jgi:hypothetical protein
MAVSGLYFFWILYVIAANILLIGLNSAAGQMNAMRGMMSGVGAFINIAINVVVGGTLLYGALQMKKLGNYILAMVAAIIAIVPCNYCCCASIPIGIWALVVLLKPEVKAAFAQK